MHFLCERTSVTAWVCARCVYLFATCVVGYALTPLHAVRVHGATDDHRQLHRVGPRGAPAEPGQDATRAPAREYPNNR